MFLDELHRYGGNTVWSNQGFEGGLLDAPFTIKSVIPWMFAYDRLNYAKYPTVYYNQMQN